MSYKPQAIIFLKKALGDEGFEELQKFELYKKKTNTALDPEEIRIALQIVPRTILSFLQKELGSMKEDEGKEIQIPVEPDATLSVTKFANDVYSGEIHQKGKVVSSFKFRSLPGVGLVIMTAFEAYDMNDFNRMGQLPFSNKSLGTDDVQRIIDERLKLRDMVSQIVDDRINQHAQVKKIVAEALAAKEKPQEVLMEIKKEKKPLKLKQFVEKISQKTDKPNYSIKIEKSESVQCPDCGNVIFDNSGYSGCICFGPDRNKKIHIKKSEEGVRLSFSKGWDIENIEMLLEVLRERRNRSNR